MPFRNDDRRRYEGDIIYDVWRNGGNPDAIGDDRMDDAFYDRVPVDDFVKSELRRQRRHSCEEQEPEEPVW